jgi:ribosomal subunit interface protein
MSNREVLPNFLHAVPFCYLSASATNHIPKVDLTYTKRLKQNIMKIQFNTDKNIEGTEELETYVSEKINSALKHFDDKITRIEVHLSDQNADKGGTDDIQCKMEARLEGIQPVMVVSKNASKEKTLDNAVGKMKAKLSSIMGKMKNK